MTDKTAEQLMPCLGCDDLRCNDCFESKCRELGYTRADSGEAVAWMTHHDAPMVFTYRGEAAEYCNDDEQPIPLFTYPNATSVDVRDKFRLDWLDTEACTVRAVETDNGRDMHFEVVSYHMAIPTERIDGIGSTPRAAIDAAIASREGEGNG